MVDKEREMEAAEKGGGGGGSGGSEEECGSWWWFVEERERMVDKEMEMEVEKNSRIHAHHIGAIALSEFWFLKYLLYILYGLTNMSGE
ncbi:hypothetical protein LIER_06528 [Lithospermum erythrorhizon]|uniref:Uncharacterized protein n=1 Tax=Lithospermum erythrorhizon TaxID=34254 RepID=A0AAV3P8M4_LITER